MSPTGIKREGQPCGTRDLRAKHATAGSSAHDDREQHLSFVVDQSDKFISPLDVWVNFPFLSSRIHSILSPWRTFHLPTDRCLILSIAAYKKVRARDTPYPPHFPFLVYNDVTDTHDSASFSKKSIHSLPVTPTPNPQSLAINIELPTKWRSQTTVLHQKTKREERREKEKSILLENFCWNLHTNFSICLLIGGSI